MNKQHTPGPWAISGKYHSIGIAPDDGQSDGIANVFGCGPQAEADARLIAAAPDLLSALEECITTPGALAERSHEYAMRRLAVIAETARTAIAKAKGGEQ